MIPYLVGYYKPTYEFTRIPEFMAIYDRQGNLIGLTGPSTSRQAAQDARLFALSPNLYKALGDLCAALKDSMEGYPREDQSEDLELKLAFEQAQEILRLMESGSPIR